SRRRPARRPRRASPASRRECLDATPDRTAPVFADALPPRWPVRALRPARRATTAARSFPCPCARDGAATPTSPSRRRLPIAQVREPAAEWAGLAAFSWTKVSTRRLRWRRACRFPRRAPARASGSAPAAFPRLSVRARRRRATHRRSKLQPVSRLRRRGVFQFPRPLVLPQDAARNLGPHRRGGVDSEIAARFQRIEILAGAGLSEPRLLRGVAVPHHLARDFLVQAVVADAELLVGNRHEPLGGRRVERQRHA